MLTITHLLRESDAALLRLLVEVWGAAVDAASADVDTLIGALDAAMRDRDRVNRVWGLLGDDARGALRLLAGGGGKMPESKFERPFGDIRRMGADALRRDKPHTAPANASEALFYRGIIGRAHEQSDAGYRAIVYVPTDLLPLLPLKTTSYDALLDPKSLPPMSAADTLGDDDDLDAPLDVVESVTEPVAATTMLIDDLTTLLAYLQLQQPLPRADGSLAEEDAQAVQPFLLDDDADRLHFAMALAYGAGLIERDAGNGRIALRRDEARRWLKLARSAQVRALAEAWRDSETIVDLALVPGLVFERDAGTLTFNPMSVRLAILGALKRLLPAQDNAWWSLDDAILRVYDDHTDFLRADGDYESLYIRNEEGDYLKGVESWDAVEGALIEYTVMQALHWLGLVDVADDAARLNTYGRAFFGRSAWVQPPDAPEAVSNDANGMILIGRKVSRFDRFQIARFTSWGSAGDVYQYRLDARGIEQGMRQGIMPGHISDFLETAFKGKLPAPIAALLKGGGRPAISGDLAQVTLEEVVIVRTTAREVLDRILNEPALRRFMGARLGDTAAIVRAEDMDAFASALRQHGIDAEWRSA